ncbi:MAG TPA: hypothetical protein VGN12_23635 [Pirellulales bacterium]|jgi:hypothetical protein
MSSLCDKPLSNLGVEEDQGAVSGVCRLCDVLPAVLARYGLSDEPAVSHIVAIGMRGTPALSLVPVAC